MIDRESIKAVLEQYKKHGWILRRVLLSDAFRTNFPDHSEIFGGADVRNAGQDAIWFSRVSRPHFTAWELRRLTGAPYAVVENIRDEMSDEEVEAQLASAEAKMLDAKPKHQ